MVQQFTEAFVQALQIPDGPTSDSGFKMEVLKVSACCWGCWESAGWSDTSNFSPLSLVTLGFFPITSQAVTALVKNFPKHMVSSMQQILPIVWNTLTESAALYPFWERAGTCHPYSWGSRTSGLTFTWFRFLKVSTRSVGVCHVPL